MISLSKTTVDINGRILLRNYQLSGEYENTARISRVKTLDGAGVLSHYGVSDVDRDLLVDCRLSPDELSLVKSFFENAVTLRISYWDGAYLGCIAGLKAGRDGTSRIKFYFREKLTS